MRNLFTFGAFGRLHVRREAFHFGLNRATRLLYASDLHLGHWWTRGVPDQLASTARETAPNVILLGGDLVDRLPALPILAACIRSLKVIAPVLAIAGNHDEHCGISAVRACVLDAGGHWLTDAPWRDGVAIDGVIQSADHAGPRVLCAHYPGDFPRAAGAGYHLVLAGHLHGGQCVLATWNQKLYPAAWIHVWHGLRFEQDNSTMLVSRGVGDTFPFRINCPREVLICDLK